MPRRGGPLRSMCPIMKKIRLPHGPRASDARYWRKLRNELDIPTVQVKRPCRRAAKRYRLTGKTWDQPSYKERLQGLENRLDLQAD